MAKYSVKDYARAFALAAKEGKDETKMVRNFLSLVAKNGDAAKLQKIFAEAERLVRADAGLKKFTIETARPLAKELQSKLHGLAGKHDIIEEKAVPELVAGVRVTINDELQFDATFARQLQKMFS